MGRVTVMCFGIHGYPELSRLRTTAERNEVRRAAFRSCHKSLSVQLGALAVVVLPWVITRQVQWLIETYIAVIGEYASELLSAVLTVLLSMFLFARIADSEIRRRIRVELASRGHAICITCGYDLRGQLECRCPECGTKFRSSSHQGDGGNK